MINEKTQNSISKHYSPLRIHPHSPMPTPGSDVGTSADSLPAGGVKSEQHVGTQNVSVHSTEGSGKEERTQGKQSTNSNTELMMAQLMEGMKQMQQMIAMQQQRMDDMESGRAGNRRTVSDTLHVVSSGERVGEYRASASVQQPPVLGAQHRRQSIGIPSSAFTPGIVSTPRPAAVHRYGAMAAPRMGSLDEGSEEDDRNDAPTASAAATTVPDIVADDGLPAFDSRMLQVRKAMFASMKSYTFHGQPDVDKLNVLSWVEKVDTEFSINMGTRQAGRLDIVRSLLAGPALMWMNEKTRDLTRKAARGELSEEIEWETMRRPFIDQHLGVNTIETFKQQLRALKLGSTTTPTPVELNQEFDRLAALAYPSHHSDMRETVLGDEYGTIIASSNLTIYRSVAYTNYPSTLDEWKLHVSRRWAAGKNAEAVEARVRGSAARGNYYKNNDRSNAGSKPAASAAAMQSTDGAGVEGQQGGEDEDADEQLSAASGRQGGQRPQWSDETKRRYKEGRCFTCGEKNHMKDKCPKKLAEKQQGKDKAGK